jgi:hypothetical protein
MARYVLPVPAGPIPEHDVVLLDRIEIAALVRGLRGDTPLAGLPDLAALQEVLAEIDARILGDELRRGLDVAHRQRVALADERRELRHELGDAARVVGQALDDELVALCADGDVQE